jgi:hypothetical protein
MYVTLLVLWNLPVMYLAALRLTFSILLFCFLVCGDQMVVTVIVFDTNPSAHPLTTSNQLFPHTVVLWNALPPDVVSASLLDQFKS